MLRRLAVEGVAARREVGAGAEGAACAGDDDRADVVVGIAGVMNFVRMSASVRCFLSIALLQGSQSFANANDS